MVAAISNYLFFTTPSHLAENSGKTQAQQLMAHSK